MAIFAGMQLFTSVYAWRCGGSPERIIGALLFLAFLATLFSHSAFAVRFARVETGVLLIDGLLMVALVAVALRADRGWPMLLAGLHLATLAVHAARYVQPSMIPVAYAVMLTVTAYPMVGILALGTRRHQRRLAETGNDRDWSAPCAPLRPEAGH